MKAQALHLCDQDQAVIFFSGWGMDAEPFAHWPLRHFSRDLWLVHSYHCPADPTFLTTMKSYREIRIISWSFGVRCAWDWINTSATELSVTSLTAINGTLTPIHRQEGIVPSIALKTLHGLTEQTYAQFLTNMCGSLAGTFVRPKRDLQDLHKELQVLIERFCTLNKPPEISHRLPIHAIIGMHDRIFSANAQKKSWEKIAPQSLQQLPCSHWNDNVLRSAVLHAY